MRPSLWLLLFSVVFFSLDGFMVVRSEMLQEVKQEKYAGMRLLVEQLGITDLCLSTEARYTRHLAVSDGVVPFMEHPGAIEHFPTGSFYNPPPFRN